MDLLQKLEILADAAKYDASCASSGTARRSSLGEKNGVGSTEGMGICHAYAPDGRCISLLKILLTNSCVYDCLYCINRRSSNVQPCPLHGGGSRHPHPRLLPPQLYRGPVPQLRHHPRARTTPWNKSSASPASLREEHGFRGYIHLKTIPGRRSRALLAGSRANTPTGSASTSNSPAEIRAATAWPRKRTSPASAAPWGRMRLRIDESKADRRSPPASPRPGKAPR